MNIELSTSSLFSGIGSAQVFRRVNTGIAVRFTQLELDAVWALARKRQEAKRGGSVDRRSDRAIDNIQMHYIGIKGEYALAKFLGVGFDMRSLTDGDDYGDIEWNGKRIEVKNLQDWLVFTPGSFRADIAVLVNPLTERHDHRVTDKKAHAFKDVILAGWIGRAEFDRVCFPHNFGYGTRYCVQRAALLPMEQLYSFGEL